VRVHWMFWLTGLIFGSMGAEDRGIRPVIIWVLVVFVSVLIHELGHALVIRALGAEPWITLYGMGGLTAHSGRRFRPQMQILVSAAGPAAGFLLAALTVLLIKATGQDVQFVFGWPYLIAWRFRGFTNMAVAEFCHDMLYVNIWWGILNLLPILPLDGGHITQEVLNICHPRGALQITLWTSVIVATAMAVAGLNPPVNIYRVLLFASLAYSSYQMLTSFSGGRRQ
jgi:stage IV sporulation protein FB